MIKTKFVLFVAAALLAGGCSLMPYEEEFACEGDGTYGKCVSVQGAYDEAVTGKPQGRVITKEGVSDDEPAHEPPTPAGVPGSDQSAYADYRQEQYRELRELIAQPETPMVRQAVQNRTLILSYSPTTQRDRLYMPRYIYSIHKAAEFVMGQYQLNADPTMYQIQQFLDNQAESDNGQ